tara:strand:+ start:110 stop:502 length:393 start_codon:yes stop_codon:yes gene_type:complete
MGVIKPVLTITANASGAASEAGPASIAFSLEARPDGGTATVTSTTTEIHNVTGTRSIIYTGSTGPAYVYLKNTSDSAVFIGGNADMSSANRILNLASGDFAWLPMSDDQDLYAQVASGTKTLEVWVFDKS